MPNVTFEKTGNVTGKIAVNITKEELNEKLVTELKKQRAKVSMKGFRKGKTPLSTLRKMMGDQILGQILDDQIRTSLFGHIEQNEIKLIFSPAPVDDNQLTIRANSLADVNLEYDLALEPAFDIVFPGEPLTKYVLKTDDAFVNEQIDSLRKRAGESEEVEEATIEEEDILTVTITETGPVSEPLTNEAKLYVSSLSDAGKALFLGKAKGDTLENVDLASLEKDSSETYVKKYLLELEDMDTDIEGKSFNLTIDAISRIVPATLDEAFFASYDASGGVTTEEELREDIIQKNAEGFERQGISMLNYRIQRQLVANTEIELPIAFMEKLQEEDPQNSFELFQESVKWMLIRNKFAAEKEIKVQYEDVREEALASLLNMLGGQRPDFLTDEFVDNYVGQMLQDEQQREKMTADAYDRKVMTALRDAVEVAEAPLTVEEFNETIKAFNEEVSPAEEE